MVGPSDVMPAKREPLSAEISDYARKLAELATSTAQSVHEKLHPVMRTPAPATTTAKAEQPSEYPPLFADLRDKFMMIHASIESIKHALSLTEL